MSDPVYDAIELVFEESGIFDLSPSTFQDMLAEAGFMIVPIEDPTNMFGIQEDSE